MEGNLDHSLRTKQQIAEVYEKLLEVQGLQLIDLEKEFRETPP